ncbi:TonB-dependent receptor plug domain-containing protein [Flammeovirgaceae bacterium SG7u.111]|nr:TonB-dependent receptor plug domain-containing protein [Flammeovirgaceae bacterium SG7u.132]WPO34012.1 TonB-dependent receptor plug domain-containing protein [Flammeovirgaceae bacterium SG7u.111]
MMNHLLKTLILLLLVTGFVKPVLSQPDTLVSEKGFKLTVEEDILNLPVEGIQGLKVYGASNKLERAFDSPFDLSVIGKRQIELSGANSVPEVLKLCPGVIVRQKSNGNYDVQIRGAGYFPGGDVLSGYDQTSQLLVMIDGIPMIDYLWGDILWEALPVDMNDIERIEVVRGGNPVYGNNAVAGSINIVTKSKRKNGLSGEAMASAGTDNNYQYNGAINYGIENKLQARLSGYYHTLNRPFTDYYSLVKDQYIQSDSLLFYNPNAFETNTYSDAALQKYGANGFLTLKLSEGISFDAQLGLQNSLAQTTSMGIDTLMAMVMRRSKSNFFKVNGNIHGLNIQVGLTNGERNYSVDYPNSDYNFSQTFVNVSYNFKFNKLVVIPGISYQTGKYSNISEVTSFNPENQGGGSNLGPPLDLSYQNTSFYLNGDLKVNDKLRLLGVTRLETYNIAESFVFNGALTGTYKVTNDFIFRAGITSMNASPFLRNYPQNQIANVEEENVLILQANKGLKSVSKNSIQVGLRTKAIQNTEFDLEFFFNNSNNYLEEAQSQDSLLFYRKKENSSLETKQFGVTAKAIIALFSRVQLGTFITLQSTQFTNLNQVGTNVIFNNNFDSTVVSYTPTPQFYGGAYLEYSPLKNLSTFANMYYFSGHSLMDRNTERPMNGSFSLRSCLKILNRHFFDPIKYYLAVLP